jgi:multisubunit Na+/H+ antiporter MnhE subunit
MQTFGYMKYVITDMSAPCGSCQSPLTGKFCNSCGQPAKLPRVNGHYILHELQHILHFEKGILYTIKELLSRPGQNVKAFISDNRSRVVKPVIFIIVTSLVYSTVNHFFRLETEYIKYQTDKHSATSAIFLWITSHYGYANIILGLFIATCLKLLFKRFDYNIFEILILLCFVMGIGMLIFAFFAMLEGLTKLDLMAFAGMTGIVYYTWAVGQFFAPKRLSSYFKALFAYLLGTATFSLTAMLLGFIVDTIQQ